MLIPTTYNQIPSKQACNNGSKLFGVTMSTMCSSLAQLSHVKFLGHANYIFSRSAYNSNISFYNGGKLGPDGNISKGATESFKLFYKTTQISQWLNLIIAYVPGSTGDGVDFDPVIEIEIKALNDSGSGYSDVGYADYGIRFDKSNSLQLAAQPATNSSAANFIPAQYVDTGIIIPTSAPTNTTPVPPRPLYIPNTVSTYQVRGELVQINVSCEDCKVMSVTVVDIYQAEETP
jgi:hypothetical protein